ncbi:MAG: hypothetical protein H0T11_00805 [Chthoniobacterales bacterium]|nr:hypothetical protein [Chthoniobacterales bacterium]
MSAAVAVALLLLVPAARSAENVDPEIARMLERALQEAEAFRKQLPTIEYDARMRVQEWDGRGRLRGTAKATAIMRPGDTRPITFLSREVEGKVRLPDDKPSKKEEDEKEVTLQQFADEHRIPERFDFTVTGTEQIAGERARRVTFKPRTDVPAKNTADRFLGVISGTAWVSESRNKLVKLELQLTQPFQLFWIFAVLKDLSIQYELVTPDEILGRSKLKVLFALSTPIYSIRQQHDVEIDNFRRRNSVAQR